MSGCLQFREEQRFDQWIRVMTFLSAILVWTISIRRLVDEQRVGNGPMPDGALVLLLLVLGIAIPALFAYARLKTEVRNDGLYVQFYPFHRTYRHFPFERIKTCTAQTYRPIRDYGGWGIRYGPKGSAYNISGNRGIMLKFTDGNELMIGSQRADELANFVECRLKQADKSNKNGL